MADDTNSSTGFGDSNDRHWVTMVVLVGSLGGILALAILIVMNSDASDAQAKTSKDLFNALLPVLGTWVGTVLAFYFSKANFEAASKSISNMADKVGRDDSRLKQIPVQDKMRVIKDIKGWPITAGDEAKSKLSDILTAVGHYDRIPMMDEKTSLVYLVYKNMLHEFLSALALDPTKLPGKTAADATFQDVLNSNTKLKDVFQKSFGFVALNSTLADAKDKMEAIGKTIPCNDIFVTQTGDPKEPIIGWITDNTISANLKV